MPIYTTVVVIIIIIVVICCCFSSQWDILFKKIIGKSFSLKNHYVFMLLDLILISVFTERTAKSVLCCFVWFHLESPFLLHSQCSSVSIPFKHVNWNNNGFYLPLNHVLLLFQVLVRGGIYYDVDGQPIALTLHSRPVALIGSTI